MFVDILYSTLYKDYSFINTFLVISSIFLPITLSGGQIYLYVLYVNFLYKHGK